MGGNKEKCEYVNPPIKDIFQDNLFEKLETLAHGTLVGYF